MSYELNILSYELCSLPYEEFLDAVINKLRTELCGDLLELGYVGLPRKL